MSTGKNYNVVGLVVTSAAQVEVDVDALSRGATLHSITADGDALSVEYSHNGGAYKSAGTIDGNESINIQLVSLSKLRFTSVGTSTVYISGV